MHDPRIRAFVSLDLGMARGFTPESLAGITAPALLVGAGIDIGDLPAELETGWLAQYLPSETTEMVIVPDAMHFSFLQLCKQGAEAMIEAEGPGDGIVCRDGGERGRAAIHGRGYRQGHDVSGSQAAAELRPFIVRRRRSLGETPVTRRNVELKFDFV